MQIRLIFFLLFTGLVSGIQAQDAFNKSSFYSVIQGQNLKDIDRELDRLKGKPETTAFEGALMMKKAGLVSDPARKLKLFNGGHDKFESAIKNEPEKCEYYFLRLIIQENAPKIVNYNSDIKKDASYLRKNYESLSPVLQKILVDYCMTSKELKPEDFKAKKT